MYYNNKKEETKSMEPSLFPYWEQLTHKALTKIIDDFCVTVDIDDETQYKDKSILKVHVDRVHMNDESINDIIVVDFPDVYLNLKSKDNSYKWLIENNLDKMFDKDSHVKFDIWNSLLIRRHSRASLSNLEFSTMYNLTYKLHIIKLLNKDPFIKYKKLLIDKYKEQLRKYSRLIIN